MDISLIPLSQSPHQASRVLLWALDLWGDHFPNYTRQDWADFYSHTVDADYSAWKGDGQELVYLAMRGDTLVATIGLVDFDELEEFRNLTPWIAAFIVNPDLRGKGLGSQVLELLEDEARRLGIDELHLWTEDQSQFYSKRGYSHISAAKLGSLDIDVMQKRL